MSTLSNAAPRPPMDEVVLPAPASDESDRTPFTLNDLSRRGFLRGAALTGGGIMAATLAACAPAAATPSWTYGPVLGEPPTGATIFCESEEVLRPAGS